MSGTINNAIYCAETLARDYPDRRIVIDDTLCASAGEAFFVREAARKQAEGLTLDELVEWALHHRLEVCHWFTVDTLDHLRHGGRISTAAAAIGNMLSIKPLLHVDDAGRLQLVKKPRGRKMAMREQLDRFHEGWNPERGNTILVAHGDNPQAAETLAESIHRECPEAEIVYGKSGPSSERIRDRECWL